MNVIIAFLVLLKRQRKRPEKCRPEKCRPERVFYQLSYQANWEQVVMWVVYKPIEVEADDHNTSISI